MKEWVLLQDARDEGREEGIEQGIEQGIERGIRIGIETMLKNGKTVEEIADFCGYPPELIKSVEEEMLAEAE